LGLADVRPRRAGFLGAPASAGLGTLVESYCLIVCTALAVLY
jgi:hypothetical protein